MFSIGTGRAVAQQTSSATEVRIEREVRQRRQAFDFRQKQRLILCLVLFAATLVFYNPVVHDGFVHFDDDTYILNNPAVRAGLTWSTLKWSFTTFHSANWHPLTWLSHALDCQIFGVNPAGHHYVSLLFHAANAVLLFLVLQEATALMWPSLIVAAIFALHPVNVESVTWAAERKNVLSMFFFLLAMLIYGRYARKGGVGRYLGVTVCFLLGMMAKPQIITLPCVLLLWDYWPLERMFPKSGNEPDFQRRSLKFLLLEKIPLFAIMLAGGVITLKAQHSGDAVRTLGDFSLKVRLENAIVSYAKYLANLVWPRHLAPLYPHPGESIPLWQVVLSGVVLATITAVSLRYGLARGNFQFSQNPRESGRRYLAVGWLWFIGVLVPMIGIVQVGEQAMADRYLYIPMIGVLIAVVWAGWKFAEGKAISKKWICIPATIIVFVLGALTYQQLDYWKDGETLWRYTLTVTRRNYMAHDELATVLAKQGRIAEAIPEFVAAEQLHDYPLPQVLSMGLYLQQNGDVADAAKMFAKVANKANDAQLRATAWSQIGYADAQIKNYEQAELSFANALQSDPENAAALLGSGLLAERSGHWQKAVEQLTNAVKAVHSDVSFLLLADALEHVGHAQEAQTAEASAAKISPDLNQARQNATDAERFLGVPAIKETASLLYRESQK